jgi:uncharacterized surface protein with fasciclin (FAS1) repeats
MVCVQPHNTLLTPVAVELTDVCASFALRQRQPHLRSFKLSSVDFPPDGELNMRTMIKSLSVAVALTFAGAASAGSYDKAGKDIVAIASGNPDFSTLVTALKAADLVGTLQGDGPFTVFAPTNAAFAKLPAGTVENLLKPENKAKLVSVLTYHVVAGEVMAADVVKLSEATTVNGQTIDIGTSNGVTVGNATNGSATVVTTDIDASNGVIHVIDSVILPE